MSKLLDQAKEDTFQSKNNVNNLVNFCCQGNGSTDDQKLVHKLERENDELRARMREINAQKREEETTNQRRDSVDGTAVQVSSICDFDHIFTGQ